MDGVVGGGDCEFERGRVAHRHVYSSHSNILMRIFFSFGREDLGRMKRDRGCMKLCFKYVICWVPPTRSSSDNPSAYRIVDASPNWYEFPHAQVEEKLFFGYLL